MDNPTGNGQRAKSKRAKSIDPPNRKSKQLDKADPASKGGTDQRDSFINNDHAEDTGARTKEVNPKSIRQQQQDLVTQRELMLRGRNELYIQQYLVRKSNFDRDEVRTLQLMYRAFRGNLKEKKTNKKVERVDRMAFRSMIYNLFGITNNNMLDRIFEAFDGDSEGTVSEVEWILGLSILLRGSLDQQIAYTYDVYDINQDRSIGREEVSNCVRGGLYAIPGVLEMDDIEEATSDLTDLVMKKFDVKRDNGIDFTEYRHLVRKDPLLLEALGECLPSEKALLPFVALLNNETRKFTNHFSVDGDPAWAREKERYAHYIPEVDRQHEGFLDEPDDGRILGKIGADAYSKNNLQPFISTRKALKKPKSAPTRRKHGKSQVLGTKLVKKY